MRIVSEKTKKKISDTLKGHPVSAASRLKMSIAGKPNARGFKSKHWKGENAKYCAIHDWVRYWKGTPGTCEMCGRTGLSRHQIQWANIDHEYRRVLNDYIRLCAQCHKDYDVEHGFSRRNKKKC